MASEVHVRYEGRSLDITFDDLDLGELSTDAEVRRAVAGFLEVPTNKLANFSVDRTEEGDVTLRPQAVFGSTC